MAGPRIAAVIPTLNEEAAIAGVVGAIPRDIVADIIVVDSGSTDRTCERAGAAGARVVSESRRGYGRACRAGAEAAAGCDIVVFLDGDGSDCPEMIPDLVAPIAAGRADFVIGSRTSGRREKGSMTWHQVFAGRVLGAAVGLLYGVRYSDMGPLRAIRREPLLRLGMRETTYGWNLEMQMRAARAGLRVLEVPVAHRRRAGGVSKVSGNLRGTLRAGIRIVLTFVRVALDRNRPPEAAAPLPAPAPRTLR